MSQLRSRWCWVIFIFRTQSLLPDCVVNLLTGHFETEFRGKQIKVDKRRIEQKQIYGSTYSDGAKYYLISWKSKDTELRQLGHGLQDVVKLFHCHRFYHSSPELHFEIWFFDAEVISKFEGNTLQVSKFRTFLLLFFHQN